MRRALFACALAIAFAGCHNSAFARAEAEDTPDAWRSYLRAHDDDKESDLARARLVAVSWKAAQAEDSPRAYRQFAEEFPEDEHHDEAIRRLAELRYAQAADAPSLEGFLEDEPKGPFSAEARRKLAALELEVAKRAPGPKPLELYLARFPDGPERTEAITLEDDRAFEEAKAHGSPGLRGYLATHKLGSHRAEAERLVRVAKASALLLEWRFDEAQAEIRALGPAPEAALLSRRLEAGRREAALARLDGLGGVPRRELEDVQALALTLRPPDPAAIDQLAEGLEDGDPRRRWETAERLGRTGSVAAIDPLLGLVSRSRFWRVRVAAERAFLALAAGFPPEVRDEELGARLERVGAEAASSELEERVALLELGLGRNGAARESFVAAERFSPGDLFAAWGILECDRASGGAPLLADARDLAALADGDALARATDDGTPPLLAERQLCGLLDLEDAALRAVPPKSGDGELSAAIQRHQAHVHGRLELAEQRLRVELPEATGCDATGNASEVNAPAAARLLAVASLARHLGQPPASLSDGVRAVLEETSSLDGSPDVRKAAAAALAAR
ncbi:MAG: tetratricopeptide repeat protein [Deltaproteobacteria bacterium]